MLNQRDQKYIEQLVRPAASFDALLRDEERITELEEQVREIKRPYTTALAIVCSYYLFYRNTLTKLYPPREITQYSVEHFCIVKKPTEDKDGELFVCLYSYYTGEYENDTIEIRIPSSWLTLDNPFAAIEEYTRLEVAEEVEKKNQERLQQAQRERERDQAEFERLKQKLGL